MGSQGVAESGEPPPPLEVTLQIRALVLDDGRVTGSVAAPDGAEEAFDGWLELLGQLARALGPATGTPAATAGGRQPR